MIQVPATVKYPADQQPRASRLPGGRPYHSALFTTQQFGEVRVYADSENQQEAHTLISLQKGQQLYLAQLENNGKVYHKLWNEQMQRQWDEQQMQQQPQQDWGGGWGGGACCGEGVGSVPAIATTTPGTASTAAETPAVQFHAEPASRLRPLEAEEVTIVTGVCEQRAQLYAHIYSSLVNSFYAFDKKEREYIGNLGELTPSMEELGLSARTLMIRIGDSL